MKAIRRTSGVLVGAAVFGVSAAAGAHFVLKAPANWAMQDTLGGPQKMGPCGNEGAPTPSNVVTPFQPGDQVTIQIDETIFHPGHYRVSLAATQNELPAEPAVTPSASDQCASAAVEMNPTLPVLADNLLVHTSPFGGMQSVMVTLPANPPCTNCVLQVLEFMSSHGAPCFYHHCANITIGGGSSDAGSNPGTPDSGGADAASPAPAADSGCSCSVARRDSSMAFAPFAALACAVAIRRRSRRR
jgi:hypothetical protein